MEDGELTLVKRRGELRMRGARRSRRRGRRARWGGENGGARWVGGRGRERSRVVWSLHLFSGSEIRDPFPSIAEHSI